MPKLRESGVSGALDVATALRAVGHARVRVSKRPTGRGYNAARFMR